MFGLFGWWVLVLGCSSPPPPPPEAPVHPYDVLIITGCSWRADHVGAYGSTASLTPHMDALAAQSVVFENAYANATYTDASHASLFTGLYPAHEGLLDFGNVINPQVHTLPEIMALYGYRVQGFVDSTRALHPIGLHNMSRGFGKVQELQAEELLSGVSTWVRSKPTPWLAWVHLRRSHIPYGAGEEYEASLHPAVAEWLRAQAQAVQSHFKKTPNPDGSIPEDPVAVFLRKLKEDPAVAASLDAAYGSGVKGADERLGEILDGLEQQQLLAHTVVVLAGDHGEALGEGDRLGHQGILSEEVLRVPLMVRVPGLAPRRESALVSLVDLLPTITELAGQVAPAGVDGQSLLPALKGEPIASRPVLAEAVQLAGDDHHSVLVNALIDPPYWYNSGPQLLQRGDDGRWREIQDPARADAMEARVRKTIEGSMWTSLRPQLPESVRKELQERGYW